MTATARLRRVGGSTMVAIPPALLDALNMGANTVLDLSIDHGSLVMKPARSRYTLAELLAQCDTSATIDSDDREWLDNRQVGEELI